MKKKIRKITAILFIALLIFMGFVMFSKISHKKEVAENIKTIPNFSYNDINGDIFSNENLKNHTPILFIYFNSECEFCNNEATMIKENIVAFKETQIIFISFEKPGAIKFFAQKHNLLNYDNIHFIHDTKADFAIAFDVKSLPSLILYDENQVLIERFKGQVKAETILKKLDGR